MSVLEIMNNVCLEYIVDVDGDTILVLIELCMNLMTQNHYNEMHQIELAASNILVALGKKHSIQVSLIIICRFCLCCDSKFYQH